MTLPSDAPLDPTSDQARQWLQDELSKPIYHPQPSLLDRIIEWFFNLLNSTGSIGSLPAWMVWVVLALVVLVVGFVLVVALRRETLPSGAKATGALEVPDVPAATLRARARAAAERGDWDTAVLDGVRAIARGASERVLLEDHPGLTAHEMAIALATPFPAESGPLRAAADAFDDVRYGHLSAGGQQAALVLDLADRLDATRPTRAEAPNPAGAAAASGATG